MMRERVPGSPGPGIVTPRDGCAPLQTHFFEALKKNKKKRPKVTNGSQSVSIWNPKGAAKLTLLWSSCEFALFLDFATTVGLFAYLWVPGALEIGPKSLQETCLKIHFSKNTK